MAEHLRGGRIQDVQGDPRSIGEARRSRAETKAVARADELRGLLREFGLTLAGFDPGVLVQTEAGGSLQFDGAQWRFLEPLLMELRERRSR